MKIVTVTTQKADNYGAVLQAYALQQTLLELGYENEILDYRVAGAKAPGIKATARRAILKAQEIAYYSKQKKLSCRFVGFRENYLKQTKPYYSVEEIQNNPPKAEIYLTGSDQVFGLQNSMVPIRFLDFGTFDTVRASYAASKGLYEKDEKSVTYLKQMLSRFDCISSREDQGTEYIRETLGFPCETHIDPVFMLDEAKWSEITPQTRINEPYILCFRMIRHSAFQLLVDKLKKETGCQVVSIQPRVAKKIKADKYLYDVNPQEFVQLIRDAEAVVTTSFHATAFSIIFRKKFYSLIDYKPERAISMCRMLGVENRLVRSGDKQFVSLEDIDYSIADEVLSQKKKDSLIYLKQLEKYANEKRK